VNAEYWSSRVREDNYCFRFNDFYDCYGGRLETRVSGMKGKYTFCINGELIQRISTSSAFCNTGLPIFLTGTFILFLSKVFAENYILVSMLNYLPENADERGNHRFQVKTSAGKVSGNDVHILFVVHGVSEWNRGIVQVFHGYD